ncbi:hypothetical protein H6P81_016762 [Aristolochia fimbriata]|uniref:Uncharacterized protein n=1 Tax=Aristolochia fimbriata TaxID=158543 RepID=A0AAV7ED16_ARIFI|nr:hypothetical protein H6P81_016762 [Aristolochia fimbriata]
MDGWDGCSGGRGGPSRRLGVLFVRLRSQKQSRLLRFDSSTKNSNMGDVDSSRIGGHSLCLGRQKRIGMSGGASPFFFHGKRFLPPFTFVGPQWKKLPPTAPFKSHSPKKCN